jgi:hypothetical protein
LSAAAGDFNVAMSAETLQHVRVIRNLMAPQGNVQAHENQIKEWLETSIKTIGQDLSLHLLAQHESSSPPTYLRDLAEYKEWQSDNPRNKVLWLSAPSGYGKSAVSAYAIQHLLQPSTVAYFFCNDNKTQREAYQIVGAFLHQLMPKSPELWGEVTALWESDNSISGPNARVENLASVVTDAAKKLSSRVFFVIDGIDQCPEEPLKRIVKFIRLLGLSDSNIRVMLTSQPKAEIISELGDSIQCVLGEQNCRTIHSYLEHALNETTKRLFEKCDIDPNEYFKTRHKGMFTWVRTVLLFLQEHVDTLDDFEKTLSQVPDKLNALYLKILQRLGEELTSNERPWLTEILTWLSLCQRPLSLAELEAGIGYSRNVRSGNKIPEFLDFEKTLTRYGAIVQLGSQGGVKFVSLSHDSFKQFVTDEKQFVDEICKSNFYVDKNLSNSLLAAACSTYLIAQDIPLMDDTAQPEAHHLKIEQQSPLFSYATNYWSVHLAASQIPPVATSVAPSHPGVSIETQMAVLEARAFRNWLLNCLKYDAAVKFGMVFLPWTLLGSIHDVDRWLKDHHLTFQPRKGRLVPVQTETSDFLIALREVVIQTWLSLEPGSRLASGTVFALAQKLCRNSATDPHRTCCVGD